MRGLRRCEDYFRLNSKARFSVRDFCKYLTSGKVTLGSILHFAITVLIS
jgi:hypothetical protein